WISGIVYLREPCTKVAQVIGNDGEGKPWTTRLKSSSVYKSEPFINCPTCGSILYEYDQDYAPFGSMLTDSFTDPPEWDSRNDDWEPGNQPLYVEAPIPTAAGGNDHIRAGSPFSLSNNSQQGFGTMCVGGGSKEGNECSKSFPDCCASASPGDTYCPSPADQGVCVGPQIASGGDICYDWMNCVGDAVYKLQHLFVAPYSDTAGWIWEMEVPSLEWKYTQNVGASGTSFWESVYRSGAAPNMNLCPVQAGEIVRPDDWTNDEYCGVPPIVDNILAGSTEGSMESPPHTIDLPGNGGTVFLSFSFTGNPDQMPIKFIEIDWADGLSPYPLSGSFDSGTLFTSHTYNWRNPPIPGENIKVKVRDNWDWCADIRGGNCVINDCRFDYWAGGDCDSVDTGVRVTLSG
ncbi:hypothetical protein KKF61_01650, partial [Patescibacteria group bacterium]|nr:hypothetical protein [Patescibacteria group bacterium]